MIFRPSKNERIFIMWIFESPTNYSEMVSKISKSVFIISLIILYLFCQISEDFNLFLEQISFGAVYELGGIKLNFALLVVPLLMGILEHVFKIHDKISSLLKIRIRYDKRIIISTMLKKCGNNKKVAKLSVKEIKKCMNIFYEYASSTSPLSNSLLLCNFVLPEMKAKVCVTTHFSLLKSIILNGKKTVLKNLQMNSMKLTY